MNQNPSVPMNVEAEHFFRAAHDQRFLLKHCDSCNRPHYYPRSICPLCGSPSTRWVESAGVGAIYSFSVTRRGGLTPAVIAYVSLDEGVTVLTNIVDCDVDRIRIGDRVQVTFRTLDEQYSLPVFTPDMTKP